MTQTPQPKYAPPFEAQFDKDQAQYYIIRKLLRAMHTCTLVQVLAVSAPQGDAAVGFLTVQPLILDQDTNGYVLAQTPIYNVPFFRYQAGPSAIILDPVQGDIGLALFAEEDITGVKAKLIAGQPLTGAAATDRTHSTADALYIGGVLNSAPTQWVKFLANAAGIDISTPGALTLEGQTIALSAPGGITLTSGGNTVQLTSSAWTSNVMLSAPDIQLPAGKVNAHNHPGVTTGSGNTGNMQN